MFDISGYANEVGESFRPLIKKVFVNLSYAVSIGYVLADTGSKTKKQYDVIIFKNQNHLN